MTDEQPAAGNSARQRVDYPSEPSGGHRDNTRFSQLGLGIRGSASHL